MHKKIRIISEEDHQNLLAAAGDRLLRLFLEFLWLTGTTYQDALRLRSANIDWSARLLSFTRLKHRGAPAAPMVRMPIGEDLEKILRELPESGLLFAGLLGSDVAGIFRNLCKDAGLDSSVSLHIYRNRKLRCLR